MERNQKMPILVSLLAALIIFSTFLPWSPPYNVWNGNLHFVFLDTFRDTPAWLVLVPAILITFLEWLKYYLIWEPPQILLIILNLYGILHCLSYVLSGSYHIGIGGVLSLFLYLILFIRTVIIYGKHIINKLRRK